MNRFVIRVALRKHVPLRTGIQNPQDRFQHLSSGDGFAARTSGWDIFFWEVIFDSFPVFVRESQHAANYT